MLKSDAIDLFDLSEAGRLLLRDPARLTREARLRKIPATWIGERLALPVAWVEAEAGVSAVDPEALRAYWLERLAPPSPDARRATRDRTRLPAATLLSAAEAARRIHADPRALRRLDTDGTLPSIRVDGVPHYDKELTDLLARAGDGEDDGAFVSARAARTASIRTWARFEYTTGSAGAGSPASTPRFTTQAPPAVPAADATRAPPDPTDPTDAPAAPHVTTPADPAAFEIPAELELEAIEPLEAPGADSPPSRLIEADGFDVIDE